MAHLIGCASLLSWCFVFFFLPLLSPLRSAPLSSPRRPVAPAAFCPARLRGCRRPRPSPLPAELDGEKPSSPRANTAPAPPACRSAPTPSLVPPENEKYPRTHLGRGCVPRNGDARTQEGDVRTEISPHAPGEGMCGKRENATLVQFHPLLNLRAIYSRPSPCGEAAPTLLSPLGGCVGTARSGRGRAQGAGAGFDI